MRRPSAIVALCAVLLLGCGEEDETPVNAQRGAPAVAGGSSKAAASAKDKKLDEAGKDEADKPRPAAAAATPAAGEEEAEAPPVPLPERPVLTLDGKSFSRRRDPFLGFSPTELTVVEPDRPKTERDVMMRQYAFEDLKLVAIAYPGRGMRPRALFVASDGRSEAIKQGEYFSSAEVLLAAVNRDYVEIEVVDETLAASLNLQRGERRAIQLRNE